MTAMRNLRTRLAAGAGNIRNKVLIASLGGALLGGIFAGACGKSGGGGNVTDASSGAGGSSAGGAGASAGSGGAGATDAGAGGGGAGGAGTGGSAGHGGAGGIAVGPDGCPLVPALKLTRAAQLTQTATMLVQAPGDPRLFVAERLGRILLVTGGVTAAAPFLDIRASVAPLETERGLLSLALHPQFGTNRRFYVVYTRIANDPLTPTLTTLGDLVLAEGTASVANPNLADPTLKILLTIPKAQRFHNGGMIAFGPDGLLYMSTGEDGRQYSVPLRPTLQELDNPIGKILRIDVDNPTARPTGNFTTGDVHVWDYGLRNPWRMSFDRLTGDLYIGDVGETEWEKIIFEPRGAGQKNYGWPVTEGNHCSSYSPGCSMLGITAAIHEFAHMGTGAVRGVCGFNDMAFVDCNRAVLGGYVYRGSALPELDGRYFFGEYIHNQVMSFIVKDGAVTCLADHTADLTTTATPIRGLISFAQDAQGEIYLLDIFANVYRVDRE